MEFALIILFNFILPNKKGAYKVIFEYENLVTVEISRPSHGTGELCDDGLSKSGITSAYFPGKK
jgi:hypothetical protein